MSSSDDDSGHVAKSSRTVRRKKLSELAPKKLNDDGSTIYTSIGKKSMLYDMQYTLTTQWQVKNNTVHLDAQKKSQNESFASCEVLKIKDELGEIGVDVRALDEDEKQLWLNTVQKAASNIQRDCDPVVPLKDDSILDCIPLESSESDEHLNIYLTF